MCNMDLRQKAKEKDVFFWQIAEKLGVSEATMTRRLRFELPEQEKQKYLSIIDKLSAEKAAKWKPYIRITPLLSRPKQLTRA